MLFKSNRYCKYFSSIYENYYGFLLFFGAIRCDNTQHVLSFSTIDNDNYINNIGIFQIVLIKVIILNITTT